MKANRLFGAALAVGFGLAAITSAPTVDAQNKKKPAAAAPAAPAEAPFTKKPIVIAPKGLAWGMNHKQVAAEIDKEIDELYKPVYQKTSPGVKMKALDAQIIEEKSAFRRSRIDFGNLPTGVDAGPLKGEYSYLNKESMLTLTREVKKRHFFFIQDKLWKIIDEYTLRDDHPLGKEWKEAVAKLATKFGAPGRVLAQDFDKGRMATEVDWKDGTTHLRVIQRSDTALAIAYEDLATVGNLANLRTNKPAEENAIDPAVAAATRKEEPPPGPAVPEKKPAKTQPKK